LIGDRRRPEDADAAGGWRLFEVATNKAPHSAQLFRAVTSDLRTSHQLHGDVGAHLLGMGTAIRLQGEYSIRIIHDPRFGTKLNLQSRPACDQDCSVRTTGAAMPGLRRFVAPRSIIRDNSEGSRRVWARMREGVLRTPCCFEPETVVTRLDVKSEAEDSPALGQAGGPGRSCGYGYLKGQVDPAPQRHPSGGTGAITAELLPSRRTHWARRDTVHHPSHDTLRQTSTVSGYSHEPRPKGAAADLITFARTQSECTPAAPMAGQRLGERAVA